MKPSEHELDPRQWLSSYGDYLYAYCLARVNDPETAQDLVQETYISALKGVGSFQGNSSVKTWLTSILKNKIIDHYRKRDVLKNASDYLDATGPAFSDSFFDSESGHWLRETAPQAWSEPADEALRQQEFQAALYLCIDKMPPKLAPVFIARFLDEEDSETICKVHKITSSNYWVIIHRAKVLIRSCLEKNWFMSGKAR